MLMFSAHAPHWPRTGGDHQSPACHACRNDLDSGPGVIAASAPATIAPGFRRLHPRVAGRLAVATRVDRSIAPGTTLVLG